MWEKHKSKLYLSLFLATAIILAWGAWNNYRPIVIYASCSDIAERTSSIVKRNSIGEKEDANKFEETLGTCLRDSGLY